MQRVLCCGGRNFDNYNFVIIVLDRLREMFGDFVVIQGGAKGADDLCALWARSKGLPVITVEANWSFYQKAAGAIRNQWMLDFCLPTYAVAFPGGKGTSDMIEKCKSNGLTVWQL